MNSYTIWVPRFMSVTKSTGLIDDKIYFEKPPKDTEEAYYELRCTETGKFQLPTKKPKK